MNRPVSQSKYLKAMMLFFTLFFCVCGASRINAQGKQAIVILRPPAASPTDGECGGTMEINYQIVNDLKLNNKDAVRLVDSQTSLVESSQVSRKTYETASQSKLKDLSVIKGSSDRLFYAVSLNGQTPMLALPDNLRPQKNADQSLSSFYNVMVSGEAKDGKQKRKLNLALREVWKIYFVPEGASVNDTLFKHAAEEKSVSLWEAYLRKTNNYRGSEANSFMRDALIVCARTDLDRFNQGNYGSLEIARQKVGRAQAVKDDDSTRQLSSSIRQSQERVDVVRNQTEQ